MMLILLKVTLHVQSLLQKSSPSGVSVMIYLAESHGQMILPDRNSIVYKCLRANKANYSEGVQE